MNARSINFAVFIILVLSLNLQAAEPVASPTGVKFAVKCEALLKRLGENVENQANLSPKTIKSWSWFLSAVETPTVDLKSKFLKLIKKESQPRLIDSVYEVLKEIEKHVTENFSTKRMPANDLVTFEPTATNEDPRALELYKKTAQLSRIQKFLKDADVQLITLGLNTNAAKSTLEKLEADSEENPVVIRLEAEISTLTKAIEQIDKNIAGLQPTKSISKFNAKPAVEESDAVKAERAAKQSEFEAEKKSLVDKRESLKTQLNQAKSELEKPIAEARLKAEQLERAQSEFSDRIKASETERDRIKQDLGQQIPREVFVRLLRHLKVEELYQARREEDQKREAAEVEQKRQKEAQERAEREKKEALQKQIDDLKRGAEAAQAKFKGEGKGKDADQKNKPKDDSNIADVDQYVPVKKSTADVKTGAPITKPK